jgi:flavin reductase (DIM6/NTAB) family NADH-FMN oxidoreductase RutF
VLGAEQRELAARFASPGDRFAQLAFHVDHFGVPLLDGAITTLLCRRNRTIAAGDHLLFVGQVLEHQVMPGAPLLFVDGAYHSGPPVKENSQSRIG